MKEKQLTRQEANLKIADLLLDTILESDYRVATLLKDYSLKYPMQRAGQIICNYICGDYRDTPSSATKDILNSLFPGNPDPFYEESTETLDRLNAQRHDK